MAVDTDVLAMMDAEEKRASERPKGDFVPTFLRLKDKQKARIRPLLNLSQCVVMPMHSKYNQSDPKASINAVCAKEVGADCPHCAAVKDDKKLSAGTSFFLPVYVSQVEQKNDNGIWIPVTYQKDGTDEFVSGLRILELKAFGSINQVLQFLRNLYREDDTHDIRQYGLIIERSDANPKNPTYTTLPKGPSDMPDVARKLVPTQDVVRQMVLAACPPAGVTVAPTQPATPPASSAKDEDF